MWCGLSGAARAGDQFASSAVELQQSTARNLILAAGGLYLGWHLAATVHAPATLGLRIWLITPLVALSFALSLHLLRRHFVLAQVAWQVGLAAAITFAAYLFQQPDAAYLYALLPLIAVISLGWQAALLAEGLLIALLYGLLPHLPMPALSNLHTLGALFAGACTGLIGWSATRTLLTVTQWSLSSYEQAQRKVEEAREQRLELKQTQDDLIQANRELARLSDRLKAMYQITEEARRAKEEFVANVSHELRTPLNMIIGLSEMITESPQVYGGRLPPALLSDIAAIHLNSQNLARLVDDVLDLSQVEAGRMSLTKEWARLPGIIEAAVLAVQPLFEAKGLYMEMDVPPGLPPAFCDSTRIRQVVLNLLSNASRFTERGGIRVRAWREEAGLVVSVADTGPGIAPADQAKLFEPFQQLDASIRRRHGGSGLGLSISKRFVEMHGGKMWFESEVGGGTTFYFSLPLETPLPAALAGAGDAVRWFSPYSEFEYRGRNRPSRAEAPLVVPRYVLLEKGDTLQRLFRRYLEGFEVTSVQDTEAALAELARSPAQALIVNARAVEEWPVSLQQWPNLPYDTPVVNCWVPGEDEAAGHLGVLHYLVKPVTREALLSALASLGGEDRTVLLVDDQPDALRLFARMLGSAGRSYRVLRAKNGARALSLLRERRPDVMLLDLVMPGMDGFQVLREKSEDPSIRDIPVIIISSRDRTGEPVVSDRLTVARSGGLSVRELLACIRAVSEILSVKPGGREPQGKPAV